MQPPDETVERQALASILAEMRERTGVDFSRYRPGTVERRIGNRMISLRMESFATYLARLKVSAEEAQHLLHRMTIKVSRFYRNAAAFDMLRARVLPALAEQARGAPLRFWSAGCGNGEEAWTFAMLLDEAGHPGEVLGTDIDPEALAAAHRGVYAADAACDLPAPLAARYLQPEREGARRVLRIADSLRSRVSFTRHDLLFAAAPGWSGFDLIACRNVLIYLQSEGRKEVFRVLRRALRPGGALFLGEAEWPPEALLSSLQVLDRHERIFRAAASA